MFMRSCYKFFVDFTVSPPVLASRSAGLRSRHGERRVDFSFHSLLRDPAIVG